MYSAYNLNKQGNNIQPWYTPFPVWNQSIVPCPVLCCFLTCIEISEEAGKWSDIPISLRIFHSLLWSTQSKVLASLVEQKLMTFFCNSLAFLWSANLGNLIFGSSTFSKTGLNILKFTFHVLLKPSLKNFEHYLLTCEMSATVWWFEHSLALPFFRIGMKTDISQSSGHCWVFQICWHIECSMFTASSFRIWNSSTGIHHLY